MRKILFLFLLLSKILYSQCNNCSKNFGGWIHDNMVGMKKTTNGFLYVYQPDNSYTYSKMLKYDFNCNLVWENYDVIQAFTVDDLGNIYTLGTSGYYMNYTNKLKKYDSNGTLIWEKEFTTDGCFKVVKLSLTINPKPIVNFPAKLDFCAGKSAVLDAGPLQYLHPEIIL